MKISCIVPTCDRPEFLPDTIRSILSQTYMPFEVIIVNNGKIPVSLPDELKSRVKVCDIIPYAGVAQARNFGVCVAQGDYLAFLDDDDMWNDRYLELAARAIARGAQIVISNMVQLVDGNVYPYKNPHGYVTVDKLLTSNPGTGGVNVVISKKLFFELGGYDPKLPPSEDKSLILEALLRNIPIMTLTDNSVIVRMHGTSRLTGSRRIVEGIYQFTRKYGHIMSPPQRWKNYLKISKYKIEDKKYFYWIPRIALSVIIRLASVGDWFSSAKKRSGDFIRNRPQLVSDGSQKLYAPRWISKSLSREKEPFSMSLMEKKLSSGMVVFDIGGNIGEYTLLAGRCVGSGGKVHVFEPDPRNFRILQKNIKLHKLSNVVAHNMLVGDSARDTDFNLDVDTSESSVYTMPKRARARVRSLRLPMVPIDDFCSRSNIERVDFIKLDVEGSEPLVIRGMSQMLKHQPNIQMIVEFYPEFLRSAGTDPGDFLIELSSFGFQIFGIDEGEQKLFSDVAQKLTADFKIFGRPRINLYLTKSL